MNMNSRWLAFIGFTLLCMGQGAWFIWQDTPLPGAILVLLGSAAILAAPSLLTLTSPSSAIEGDASIAPTVFTSPPGAIEGDASIAPTMERGRNARSWFSRMWLLLPGAVLSAFAG